MRASRVRLSRIHLPGPLEPRTLIQLTGDRAHYVARVLRLRPGHAITVFDGTGGEYRANISTVARNTVEVALGEHRAVERESPLRMDLAIGVSRGERMDFAVQKAVELGVHSIQPLVTEHCGVSLSPERADQRKRHWQKIVISASEQCGRNRLAMVRPIQDIGLWLSGRTLKSGLVLAPDGRGDEPPAVPPGIPVTLLVGPEGGLSPSELEQAIQLGLQPLRLGPRVLRTETAAIVALATVQLWWGDLSGPASN